MSDLGRLPAQQDLSIMEKEIQIEEKLQAKQTIILNRRKVELERAKLLQRFEDYEQSIKDIDEQVAEERKNLASLKSNKEKE